MFIIKKKYYMKDHSRNSQVCPLYPGLQPWQVPVSMWQY